MPAGDWHGSRRERCIRRNARFALPVVQPGELLNCAGPLCPDVCPDFLVRHSSRSAACCGHQGVVLVLNVARVSSEQKTHSFANGSKKLRGL